MQEHDDTAATAEALRELAQANVLPAPDAAALPHQVTTLGLRRGERASDMPPVPADDALEEAKEEAG